MVSRTKIHPALCLAVGLSHVAHATALILSLGLLTTRFPLAVACWACRVDQSLKEPRP